MDKKSLGNLGESAVERYLTEHGCFIVEKNYHATQGYRDEIDLIACDGSCILFVEVKTRIGKQTGGFFGSLRRYRPKKETDYPLRPAVFAQPQQLRVLPAAV